MGTILEFSLEFSLEFGRNILDLPVGIIFSCGIVDGKLTIWGVFDPSSRRTPVQIMVYATGESLLDDLSRHEFIGRVEIGPDSFHVFYLNR